MLRCLAAVPCPVLSYNLPYPYALHAVPRKHAVPCLNHAVRRCAVLLHISPSHNTGSINGTTNR